MIVSEREGPEIRKHVLLIVGWVFFLFSLFLNITFAWVFYVLKN